MTKYIAYIVLSACAAGCALLSLNLYYAYNTTLLKFAHERSINLIVGNSAWARGTVISTDNTHKTVMIEFVPLQTQSGRKRVLFATTPNTTISKQELIEEEGVYIGLTTPEPALFSDLTPGTRVAVLLEPGVEQHTLTARTIHLGNPF